MMVKKLKKSNLVLTNYKNNVNLMLRVNEDLPEGKNKQRTEHRDLKGEFLDEEKNNQKYCSSRISCIYGNVNGNRRFCRG